MKKQLAIIVTILLICVPTSVFAWNRKQIATPIVGADCSYSNKTTADGKHYIKDKNGDYIPDYNNQRCSVTVYRFTDNGNICYVVKGSNAGGIYCDRH